MVEETDSRRVLRRGGAFLLSLILWKIPEFLLRVIKKDFDRAIAHEPDSVSALIVAGYVAHGVGDLVFDVSWAAALALAVVTLATRRVPEGMRRIVMIVAIMGVALRAGGLIVAESTYSGLYPKLFVNWFSALLLSIALIASSLFLLDRYDRRPWLVAVVAVAALASIAVTTMIEGIHMRRAKRSMAFLRTATTVIECMRKESGDHPKAKTVSDLTAAVPVCISQLEPNDGWGRPIRVSITANSVVVTSLGADGRPDPPGTPRGASYDPARDIIMINGEFVSWPMGTATH